MHGTVRPGDDILMMMATKAQFHVVEVGYMGRYHPGPQPTDFPQVRSADITASIKSVKDTVVGDTVTLVDLLPNSRWTATVRSTRWSSAVSIRQTVQNIPTCATRWTSCSSTTLR